MSASDLQPPQSYSQEDVQQILHLAIVRQAETGELSRQQLWEIASELAIEPGDVLEAERQWLKQKSVNQQQREFDRYRRNQFKHKAVRFLIVNAFLVALNAIATGTLSWSLYVLLIWGLVLVLEAWNTFHTKGEAYQQAFQRWIFRNEVRESAATLWQRLKKLWQT